ncbi:bile acid:sodium symporter family protein [Hyalangium rubrum]|uniref:Bile acid:sodium symporter family protein n=1 Tax=Hyalangium rubrum TaxID=3103134 RepID=A0ABU5HIF2_9BACT|nr:bile acid:sodium symporter family protein [Hyalangium sp. s54d21]MDY7233253.1 bile acid:sodium symporter family protein [Hyalangium sp. s54d21]
METSALTTILLPLALGIIMLGLGLSLTVADFTRVITFPRAVLVGLLCQMVLLPGAGFAIAKLSGLAPELAVGLMLLAASPGGATSNLYSHLAKGDVALNITLTAVNSVLTVVTLPLIVNLSLEHFLGESRAIPLQFGKVAQIFVVVLGPVSLGMVLKKKWPSLSERLQKPVKILSALFLVLVVAATAFKERAMLGAYLQQVGVAALAFNLTSMLLGYALPRLLRLSKSQSIAIGMEIGIHNGTLAIAIAYSPMLLNNSTMAIPAAIYSLIMFFTAALFGYAVNAAQRAPAASSAASGN